MVTIKQATLLLLNKNEEVFKRIPPQEMTELYETQELRASYQIQGTVLAKKYMKDFEQAKYVAVSIADSQEYQVFALTTWKISNDDKITFTGIDEPHFELESDGFIKDRRFVMNDFSKIIQPIFEGSRWTIRSVPADVIPVGTINFYFESRLNALKEVIDKFDVDVTFSYEITGNKITNRYVDFYAEMGKDTGKRFAYGSNALSIIRETSTTDLYTAIVPRGDGIQKVDENGQATGGYSRKINISDVEWKKANGHPVDKPKGQLYIEIPERTQVFGFPAGHPKVTIKDYDGIKDTDDLIRQAYLDLLDISRPKIQFSTQVTNLGNVSLGDAVTIVMPKYQIQYKTRIFKLKIDLLTNTRSVAEFGDYVVKTAYQRAYEAWLKDKHNQDSQDEINAGINDVIDANKEFQDMWNEQQEETNKLVEKWKVQVSKDIEDARKEIGDYIKGQDQLGEIIFTGKDMLPTRGNIYNIVARSLINGQQGQLIFNSNGLGWYGADGKVKMGITNDGRVIADEIYSNTLETLTIKTAYLYGGEISGVKFKSIGGGKYMTIDSSQMLFGKGTEGSTPMMSLTGNGLNFYDDVGGYSNVDEPVGKKGELMGGFRLVQGQNYINKKLGSGITFAAAPNHIASLGVTDSTSDEIGTTNDFLTISPGGDELAAFSGSSSGFSERGIYLHSGVELYIYNSRISTPVHIGSVEDGALVLSKNKVVMEDM
ncbi:phage tail spike protein [Bombilactobacillus bombi]|uniref:phage tail spike protein n=1 Tax=Bombilactobacillus bombi TaxID=1303590 RepID=UPI0011C47F7F|nr:phage tail spike protein [Bombilactobacillus bombi]